MTNGDLAIAKQILGHADLASTLRYAKRHKFALFDLVDGLQKVEAWRSMLDGVAIEAEGSAAEKIPTLTARFCTSSRIDKQKTRLLSGFLGKMVEVPGLFVALCKTLR